MDEQLSTRKPVKIAHTGIDFEKGKEDGRGRVEVKFFVRFSLADEDDQTTAYNGLVRYRVEVWKPGTFYPVYGPAFPSQIDLRKLEKQGIWVRADKDFYRARSEEYKGQIWCQIVTNPVKLELDAVEYRYTYEVWFTPSGFFVPTLYKGHKSTYVALNLN